MQVSVEHVSRFTYVSFGGGQISERVASSLLINSVPALANNKISFQNLQQQSMNALYSAKYKT